VTSFGVWAGSLLLLCVVILVLDRLAVLMIRPRLKPVRRRATDLPFHVESVSIPSGGEALSGWAIHPESDNGGPVLVMVHGWGSNHGTMTRLARPFLEKGYPVFLFDVRHHGESRGAPYVTARHFRDDILSAVREAMDVFPHRDCVLVGHSMGGSTGILATADGAPVRGLVTIGSPGDLWSVWAYHFDRKGLPGRWIIRLLKPFWRLRAGVPWQTLDPVARVGEVSVPLFILHGAKDESVPPEHAFLLGRGGGVEPRILQGEGHTDLLESPILHEELEEFFSGVPI
jgi:pimeloyl-ACP methyl ester carboxylesterase